MSERFPDTPVLNELVLEMFSRAYTPNSTIEIRSQGSAEVIEGRLPNGRAIELGRPQMHLEPSIDNALLFQITIELELLQNGQALGVGYFESYFFENDGPVMRIVKNKPLLTVEAGPGEVADLRQAIIDSDFS